jgi:hypothetical protein
MEFVVKARYLVDTGSWDEANRLLESLEGYARRSRRICILISTLLGKAELKCSELGRVKII